MFNRKARSIMHRCCMKKMLDAKLLGKNCFCTTTDYRPSYVTKESNPALHTNRHCGKFYDIPQEFTHNLGLNNVMNRKRVKLNEVFDESKILIRNHSVDLLNCMKAASYDLPTIRYLLHGQPGAGKTTTMAHAIHYALSEKWIVLTEPNPKHWLRFIKGDIVKGNWNEERYDIPASAVDWLMRFKTMNGQNIIDYDFRTTERYIWTKREATEIGTSLMEPVEFGLARHKYANDVIGILMKELKKQCKNKSAKLLLAVDNINAIWRKSRQKKDEDGSLIPGRELNYFIQMEKLLRNDWSGGSVIATADYAALDTFEWLTERHLQPDESDPAWKDRPKLPIGEPLPEQDLPLRDRNPDIPIFSRKYKNEHLPMHLLGPEMFEMLDPFIPIYVAPFSDSEMRSTLQYLEDKHWIQHPPAKTEDGVKEILFLSEGNPGELFNIARLL